jgi:hypothetical protein
VSGVVTLFPVSWLPWRSDWRRERTLAPSLCRDAQFKLMFNTCTSDATAVQINVAFMTKLKADWIRSFVPFGSETALSFSHFYVKIFKATFFFMCTTNQVPSYADKVLFEKLILCWDVKEIFRLLWNSKFPHRVHWSRPPDLVLKQMNEIRTFKPYFLRINFSIILRYTRMSS